MNGERKGEHVKTVVACVRLTPAEAQRLTDKYGSVSKALRVLTAPVVRPENKRV